MRRWPAPCVREWRRRPSCDGQRLPKRDLGRFVVGFDHPEEPALLGEQSARLMSLGRDERQGPASSPPKSVYPSPSHSGIGCDATATARLPRRPWRSSRRSDVDSSQPGRAGNAPDCSPRAALGRGRRAARRILVLRPASPFAASARWKWARPAPAHAPRVRPRLRAPSSGRACRARGLLAPRRSDERAQRRVSRSRRRTALRAPRAIRAWRRARRVSESSSTSVPWISACVNW